MAEALWLTPAARLAPGHVYRMAGALGAELQRLSGRFGAEAVCGLVPQVVRLLELLEALVGPAEPQPGAESEAGAGAEAGAGGGPERGAEPALRARLAALQDESRELRARLARSQAQARAHEDSTARQERDVMLRLKEVVDKQRDELRAQAHEILCRSRDTEALQEQLTRFMSMNEDLRNKLAVTQAQLRGALEKNGDAPPSRREQERPAGAVSAADAPGPSAAGVTVPGEELQPHGRATSSADRGFSKEELQQILQERNELKTSLFLVREELAYYQRELLNQEHVPGLLLDAMKSVVKRQRKKIRAKMLGTVEEPASR